MVDESIEKVERILGIYTKLLNGDIVNKAEEANNYGVNERSIQRDIADIRKFLDQNTGQGEIMSSVIYDRIQKGYKLEQSFGVKLTNPEILAICKILLDSRAFPKDEMMDMIDKLIECCVPESSRKSVLDLVLNEKFHYIEPRHKTSFLDTMWEIGQAVRQCRYIEINYMRTKDMAVVNRKLKPMAIMFSEYYFYLAAFIDDEEVKQDFDILNDVFPTIYRIDRIKKIKTLDQGFHIPYGSRFEEGEFRKRIQFMYGGRLQRVEFVYTGSSIESVLDRLPTARILCEKDGSYTISAEVFGKGIDMWIRSQGDMITDVKYK